MAARGHFKKRNSYQNTQISNKQLPTATGGTSLLSYVLYGTLPDGLSYDNSARTISGTPTATQDSVTYTYAAADDADRTTSTTFSITVRAAVPVLGSIDDETYT